MSSFMGYHPFSCEQMPSVQRIAMLGKINKGSEIIHQHEKILGDYTTFDFVWQLDLALFLNRSVHIFEEVDDIAGCYYEVVVADRLKLHDLLGVVKGCEGLQQAFIMSGGLIEVCV